MEPKRNKGGRPPIFDRPLTNAERMRRHKARKRCERYQAELAARPEQIYAAEEAVRQLAGFLQECPGLTVDDIRAAINRRYGPPSAPDLNRLISGTGD